MRTGGRGFGRVGVWLLVLLAGGVAVLRGAPPGPGLIIDGKFVSTATSGPPLEVGSKGVVFRLNADLLEAVTEGDRHCASVRFSGLVRETPGAEPASFEEVWNLIKPVDGSSGWQLAGIQQMH